MQTGYRNILIIRQSALGDVVNIFPLLQLIRSRYPDARIACLTGGFTTALLESDPCVDEVIAFNRTKHPLKLMRMCVQLRRRRFDLVIDFQSSRHSRWLTLATGAGTRLGYGGAPFLTHKLSLDIRKHQACDIFRAMLVPLGLGDAPMRPRFPRLQDCQGAAHLLLRQYGVREGEYVVFNPGHSPVWVTKRWPVAHWVELGRMLGEKGVRIVVTGAGGDVPLADEVVAGIGPDSQSLAGKTSLDELAGVMSLARAVVSTDSGPMHVAAMTGVRVVALFGPTSPVTSAPFGPGHKVLHHQLSCSLCFKKHCPYRHECLDRMMPEEVFGALRDIAVFS